MGDPNAGMTYYCEQQNFQRINNHYNAPAPFIQNQYVHNQSRPVQHPAYAAYASPENSNSTITSSEFQSRSLLNKNCMDEQNNTMVNPQAQQHMNMVYGDGLSLSESSMCSSADICSPDIHPVPDTIGIPSDMVAQTAVDDSSSSPTGANNELIISQQRSNASTVPTRQSSTDIAVTEMDLMTQHQTSALQIPHHMSSDAMIHTDDLYSPHYESMNPGQPVDARMPTFCSAADTYASSSLIQNDTSPTHKRLGRSMDKSFSSHRRSTVPIPYPEDVHDFTEKESSSQSMNDLQKKWRTQKDQSQNNPFCHLSREQLIERVVQLEKEKQLSSGLLEGSKPLVLKSTKLDIPDEDDFRPCRWAGCDTLSASLDQLIVHIKDAHIGSGKAAYSCHWESCPREQKPLLKRHKMLNHMRTHTGEKPYKCPVEGCDKKFSRPDSLNTHIKTHSDVRPFSCPIESCTKAYFHSRSLRKHAKSHEINATHSLASATPISTKATITASILIGTNRGEDAISHREYPYDISTRPTKYYQQQESCGSEALQQIPTLAAKFTPMMVNSNKQPQPNSKVDIMQNYEQQTFAAGTAYDIKHEQLHYKQQQLLFQELNSGTSYGPLGASVSPHQHYYLHQQDFVMRRPNPGYNYIYSASALN